MAIDDVLEAAKRAKEAGSTRFCMGTAWRGPSQVGKGQFDRVLSMTSQVRDMGMEVRPATYCSPHHRMPCTS